MLDLASTPAAEAAAVVDAALRRFGFFYVRNHGIPDELIAQQCAARASARRFFARRPNAALDPLHVGRFASSAALFALPGAAKGAMPFDPYLDIGYQAAGSQQLDARGIPVHGDTKARAVRRSACVAMQAVGGACARHRPLCARRTCALMLPAACPRRRRS